ncbi:MAG: hypothetical protein KAR05_03820 [Candidatus Omnitrophica bacterium]|nr:hypothetical protein [Candidatus Omnitrophota bacterium]
MEKISIIILSLVVFASFLASCSCDTKNEESEIYDENPGYDGSFISDESVSKPMAPEIVERRGSEVSVVQFDNGAWQLQVQNKPYLIKGVVFSPTKIGEDAAQATQRDWMLYDDDGDGRNDVAYQSWVDANHNYRQDRDEKSIGDFALLKAMGANTIRTYHLPSGQPFLKDLYRVDSGIALQYDHPPNKLLLRHLYKDFGIRVIISNFTGSWTIGSGASWSEGTDYTNPEHRENIKNSVKAMVLDHKDEPYVLFWLLGNENNIADWSQCNAKTQPLAYAQLIGELVDMVHSLDSNHPVAVSEGDNFTTLKLYPRYAPNIDILAYNTYRSEWMLDELFDSVKAIFDRPVYIAENGIFAYQKKGGEDEAMQEKFISHNWAVISENTARALINEKSGSASGNVIGVTFFDWLDRWNMDGAPSTQNPGTRSWPSPDGLRHEEYFGIISMGDGSDWLMRQPRSSYQYLKQEWTQ